MVIAVNTRFLLAGQLEGMGYFIQECFRRIVRDHPEHQFIFIFDRPFDQSFIFGPNVTPVVTGPPARHPLLWKYWYDYKLPSVLKKYKADLFVSCDGICSLRTKVPQCLVIHDLAFLHMGEGFKKSHLRFYRNYTGSFIAKARQIATVSDFSKRDIIARYHTDPDKITPVFSAVKENFKPLSPDEQQRVKEQYTEGKEYFIYTGAIHPRKNLMGLLKAFSIFKKRLNSGMKLVLAGRLAWQYESFVGSLNTFKFRNDVIMTGYIPEEELVRLTASAWALVYPSFFEGFGVPVLEAMQSGVPVITSDESAMQEIAGPNALFVNPADPASIAEKMMLVYKDEVLRKSLIDRGLRHAPLFSWDQTAGWLWECMEKSLA